METLAIICKLISGKIIFGNFDSTNNGIYHIIKSISFTYKTRVISIIPDNDNSLGDNINITRAIDLSLCKLDPSGSNPYGIKHVLAG